MESIHLFPFFPPFPALVSPEQQPLLGYVVDHGENRSPWRRTCPSGHVELPKNTVQDSGVSLLTMGESTDLLAHSTHAFLPSPLPSCHLISTLLYISTYRLSFPFCFCPFQTTEVNGGMFFRAPIEGRDQCIGTDIPKHIRDPQLSVTATRVMCTKTHWGGPGSRWCSNSHRLHIGWELPRQLRENCDNILLQCIPLLF